MHIIYLKFFEVQLLLPSYSVEKVLLKGFNNSSLTQGSGTCLRTTGLGHVSTFYCLILNSMLNVARFQQNLKQLCK